MTRLVLKLNKRKTYWKRSFFGNWQKKDEGLNIDWFFSLFPILSQITQLLSWCHVHAIWFSVREKFMVHHIMISWFDGKDFVPLIRFFGSWEHSDSKVASEFWIDPSGTGGQSVWEDYSLNKSPGPTGWRSYTLDLDTKTVFVLDEDFSKQALLA